MLTSLPTPCMDSRACPHCARKGWGPSVLSWELGWGTRLAGRAHWGLELLCSLALALRASGFAGRVCSVNPSLGWRWRLGQGCQLAGHLRTHTGSGCLVRLGAGGGSSVVPCAQHKGAVRLRLLGPSPQPLASNTRPGPPRPRAQSRSGGGAGRGGAKRGAGGGAPGPSAVAAWEQWGSTARLPGRHGHAREAAPGAGATGRV